MLPFKLINGTRVQLEISHAHWLVDNSKSVGLYIGIVCLLLTVVCLSEHYTDCLVVYTGTLVAITHCLSCFALLVVGIPLR